MFICVPAEGEEPVLSEDTPEPVFTPYLALARPYVTSTIRLRPAADATTVRVRGHEVLLSDGPFAESKEVIAGVDLIEVDDLDEAVALASKHPAVLGGGSIEVRPVWE